MVTINLTPEAKVSYAEVMLMARKRVKLEELGITALMPRRARTGGLVLEIPGEDRTEKAAKLADCLRQMFSGTEVRVARPIKMGEVRVTDLDDSVIQAEVAAALVAAAGCSTEEVKMVEIGTSPQRMGTV
uniref:uncharacterized protein LOC117605357 n=1 Tax=Osmia lignaria TaxID=473952 RepID=UPI0014780BCC|nr:uncharacterized protein LOC117605357 [Osmia lignaria]